MSTPATTRPTTSDPTTGTPARKQPRLSINLNPEAAEFLESITDRLGISYTEAVRRALSVYKLLEDQASQGNHVQIDDGKKVRELFLV